ncbi:MULTISPECIES: TCP-1/cpn60 chaperonin family protein [Haloferax]|uniref:60 kDa chaperonin n=1 Tax=Haloferax massiliensis TaxID=1476858 RepID=A0A0D6JV69_9EURY|nr:MULTISPECIES: TCP-1/cpn60 chaperonin family protein [Haloferax]MDS0241459.1 TCP-1/cpn60 chaperonin family protein [Haloferax sp. S2CR25]MDS0444580.1 TCP-1/cpn60 chaperonin family protein [Haloferax sp. S2CR25-2]CQR52061.1 60 kDa chaperonin [Haloferax massiliensis]
MAHDTNAETGDWLARDEAARAYVVGATRAVESLLASTYGPRGSTSLVQTVDGQQVPETVVTADAGRLLDAIERGDGFVHPIAALFVDGLDSVRRGLHDGTTTAALLAAGLVEEGARLSESGLHEGTLTVGYAMAANRAGKVLDDLARPITAADRDRLREVADTAMTTDLSQSRRDAYADVVSTAVAELAGSTEGQWFDTDDVSVRTRAGDGVALVRGHVIRRRPGAHETSEKSRLSFDWTPSVEGVLSDARIAVLERDIDVEETATSFGSGEGAAVSLGSAGAVTAYTAARTSAIDDVAASVASLGVDVLVVRAELDDAVKNALESRGVAVVDRAQYPKSDVHRVARATGAQVVGHVSDLDESKLGRAGRVTERRVGDEKWTTIGECEGPVFTVVVETPTEQGRTAHERLVEDAVETTAVAAMDGQVLPGAGAAPLAVARDLRRFASGVQGKEQLAIEAFADVCESLVQTLARNASYDPLEALAAVRTAHADAATDPAPVGFDAARGEPADAWELGVVEPRRVFSQALDSAVATSEQLSTIDAVVSPGIDLDELDPQIEHD